MSPSTADQQVDAVFASTYPYDPWHDQYQEYYQRGLRQYLQLCGSDLRVSHHTPFPTFLKRLRRVRDASTLRHLLQRGAIPIGQSLDWIARHTGAQHRPSAPLVGEYAFGLNPLGRTKVCIDAHDSGRVNSPALLESSDVYLKTNYWKDHEYDPRVRPFYVCNPIVLPHLPKLTAMRGLSPVFDLCFVVRVWGGPTGIEGVEHCLRLLEAVAKVRAKKFLLAELLIGDTDAQARRLRMSGIPTTTRRIDLQHLWELTARSRLNISRLGNHHCMSWRMTDLLALGACTVLDQHPKTLWPVPLLPNYHYYSLDATTSNTDPVAPDGSYARIPERLEEILGRGHLYEETRHYSAEYFDHHMHPLQIGRQLHDIVHESMSKRLDRLTSVGNLSPERVAVSHR